MFEQPGTVDAIERAVAKRQPRAVRLRVVGDRVKLGGQAVTVMVPFMPRETWKVQMKV